MKVGFQVSSIKDAVSSPASLVEAFAKVQAMGYREVQVQYLPETLTAADVQAALTANTLACIGTQDDYPASLQNLGDIIEKNKLWGGGYLCSALFPMNCVAEDGKHLIIEHYKPFVSEMQAACKQVEEAGLIFTYHPLFFDFNEVDGIRPMDYLAEMVPEMQVTLDFYHVIAAGLDPLETIQKYKGKLDIVHFKDSKKVNGEEVLMPMGQGDTNWEPIVKACMEAGVKHCFLEQESSQKDIFECMAESYAHISALVEKHSTS